MSQDELAAAAGMSKSNLSNVEGGRQRALSRAKTPGLARALRVPVDTMVQWSAGVDVDPPELEASMKPPVESSPTWVNLAEVTGRMSLIERIVQGGDLTPVEYVAGLLRHCPPEQRQWVFEAVDQLRAEAP